MYQFDWNRVHIHRSGCEKCVQTIDTHSIKKWTDDDKAKE